MKNAENKINQLFASQLWVINVGVDIFYHAVTAQQVPAVQVDWKPPAGGDQRMVDILAQLKAI